MAGEIQKTANDKTDGISRQTVKPAKVTSSTGNSGCRGVVVSIGLKSRENALASA